MGLGVALCFLSGRLETSTYARLRVDAALSWAPGLRLTRCGADLRGSLRLAQDRWRRSLLVENLDGSLRDQVFLRARAFVRVCGHGGRNVVLGRVRALALLHRSYSVQLIGVDVGSPTGMLVRLCQSRKRALHIARA